MQTTTQTTADDVVVREGAADAERELRELLERKARDGMGRAEALATIARDRPELAQRAQMAMAEMQVR